MRPNETNVNSRRKLNAYVTDVLDHTETKTLWVTDAEIIRRSGIPEKKARALLHALDDNPRSGFPKKIPVCGDRRYWPAVQDYWAKLATQHEPRRP